MQIEITPEYLTSQGLSKTAETRFWKKVKKTDSCWLWTGARSEGYGNILRGIGSISKFIGAHRLSYILHMGPIPDGLCVLHNCPGGDNRLCVNPEHLWLGTPRDNILDCMSKIPGLIFAGVRRKRKLSKEQVDEIRSSIKTNIQLARLNGVSRHTIKAVRANTRYMQWP